MEYVFSKGGQKFLELEVDPLKLGMVTRVVFHGGKVTTRPQVEVNVIIGTLPNGHYFPLLWECVTYQYESEDQACGRSQMMTRNEVIKIETNTVDLAAVSLDAFRLPDHTTVLVQEVDQTSPAVMRLSNGALVDGTAP